MNRRSFVRGLTTAGMAAALRPRAFAQSARRPNILFLPVDDLKPLLGCYGYDGIQTPNMDRIAARGMTFINNQCQQAVCGPSRASLMTGLRPDTTQVWDLATKMRDVLPDILTLPQYLKQNGYETHGMGKIFDGRCCDGWVTQDAVSWSIPCIRPGGRLYADPSKAAGKPAPEKRASVNRPATECADVEDTVYIDGMTAEKGVEALRRLARGDKPFFLGVGFAKPHLPFCAPKKYWDLYQRDDFKIHPFQKHSLNGPALAYQDSGELRTGYTDVPASGPFPEEKQLEMIHGYHACVSFVDAQIGKLLDELDRSGVADNTILVLWGDHGWHLGDHGMWCKHSNFEQAARAPLLIAAPGAQARGARTLSPSEFVDIFPTLCELVGLSIPPQLEGASLVPILNNPEASVKAAAISQYPRTHEGRPVMGYSYRTSRYRYTQWIQKNFRKGETQGPVVATELYDYATDPMETRNLADEAALQPTRHAFDRLIANGWRGLKGASFPGERAGA